MKAAKHISKTVRIWNRQGARRIEAFDRARVEIVGRPPSMGTLDALECLVRSTVNAQLDAEKILARHNAKLDELAQLKLLARRMPHPVRARTVDGIRAIESAHEGYLQRAVAALESSRDVAEGD